MRKSRAHTGLWLAASVAFLCASFAHAQVISSTGTVTTTGAVTTGDCAKFAASTVIQDAGAACGGSGGSPGGSNGQLQYNNSGAFGGAAGLTTDASGNLSSLSLTEPNAGVIKWGTDTGLSRDSAGVIDVGNGTQGDQSGTLKVTSIIGRGNLTLAAFSSSFNAIIQAPTGTNGFVFTNDGFNGFVVKSGLPIGWSSGDPNSTNTDTFLTRRAAANIHLGASDATAVVAQTLGVQSVAAGTSNTAGANFTIAGSQGTGTGAGGSLIFQVAPVGTTGTSQNVLATALTIDSTKAATFAGQVVLKGYTVAGLPTGITGGTAYVTDATACTFLVAPTGGGSTFCPVIYNGSAWVAH